MRYLRGPLIKQKDGTEGGSTAESHHHDNMETLTDLTVTTDDNLQYKNHVIWTTTPPDDEQW